MFYDISCKSKLMKRTLWIVFITISLLLQGFSTATPLDERLEEPIKPKQHYEYFLDFFLSREPKVLDQAINHIKRNWSESDEILAIETLYFLRDQTYTLKLLVILEKETGKQFQFDFNAWYEYIWAKDPTYTSDYYTFKANLHSLIDTKFRRYFIDREQASDIRLDEVRWGGVAQDGIPPLRNPKMINVDEANYLDDYNIVFGIKIGDDVRAYPKRILAWHEMFTDTVGDTPVAGVYCTLCGTVILYKTEHNGIQYQMGTSGFLYRSNKLMYDKKTQSLWNTLWGKPVLGPLKDQGIEFEYLSVVTTTWGEWKKRHPNTKVLSLNTGHQRDYGEGVAYQQYFATDELMFNTPDNDSRLLNKQEILAIRLPNETDETIAISSKYLRRRSIFQHKINNKRFTVFTDKTGAHRTFFTGTHIFNKYDKKSNAFDTQGTQWKVAENYLENSQTGERLERLQSFNAFWFGFKAAFPETQLIK